MGALSPLEDEERRLRDEARYLVGQVRWPGNSDEEAIARTLRNYPGLTEDEISSWWRVSEFRRQVKEARAVAAEYASEGALAPAAATLGRDPYAVPAAQALSSPVGARSPWWRR